MHGGGEDGVWMSMMRCSRKVLQGCAAVLACVRTAPALAHAGEDHAGGVLAWNFDPWIVGGLALSALLYALGLRRLWKNAGRGAGVPAWRIGCYAAGMVALVVSLLSPVDTLGSELFSMHMVQHELMMLVAAPLIILGHPLVLYLWAFSPGARKRIGQWTKLGAVKGTWRVLTLPLPAWLLHAIVLWGWHFPVMFQASLKSDAVHTVQHLSFLVSALLFWAALIGTSARMRDGSAVLYILTTLIHTGMLGALLTFSSTVWYPVYAGRTEAWGLTVLEDQQLGGLIMWVPAGFVLLLAALAVAAKVVMPERAGGRHAD